MDKDALEKIVRKVVCEVLSQKTPIKTISKSGVASIRVNELKLEKFDTGKPGDKVFLKDAVTLEESPRLGFGMMEMDESTFDWTLKYDEVDYIIEGTLEILIDGEKIVGNAGDVVFIPKNSTIQFSVPKYAKFLYVTYPANWADQ
jgi:ethanolamine utilization protein EutQ